MYKREEFLKYIAEKDHSYEAEKVIFNYYKENKTIENRNLIVEMNSGLINKMSCKFRGVLPEEDMEDLYQEGFFGLCNAIERYNVDLGFKFSTYATQWVHQAMSRYVQNNKRTIRLPVHVLENAGKIRKYVGIKYANEGYIPSQEEISKELNIPLKTVILIDQFDKIASLDKELQVESGGEGMSLMDNIEDKRRYFEESDKNADIEKFMKVVKKTLSDKEYFIISKRFGFNGEPETLEQVGLKLNVTRERIRQIEVKALAKLKRVALKMHMNDYLVAIGG